MARLRELASEELTAAEVAELRRLMADAFADDEHGGFDDDDWQHALGGRHFVLDQDGLIVCHASVVERELRVAAAALRTGYVEAVATVPALQGRGHGSTVMRAVNAFIVARFELGALGTSSHGFYERLGWQVWRGPSSVRAARGELATPDDDGYIMVLRTPASPSLALTDPISCDWRAGDVW